MSSISVARKKKTGALMRRPATPYRSCHQTRFTGADSRGGGRVLAASLRGDQRAPSSVKTDEGASVAF